MDSLVKVLLVQNSYINTNRYIEKNIDIHSMYKHFNLECCNQFSGSVFRTPKRMRISIPMKFTRYLFPPKSTNKNIYFPT